jgi:hypothetical protein
MRHGKKWRTLAAAALMAATATAQGAFATDASAATGQFHMFSVSTTGNLYQNTWGGSWSGWQGLGNDSVALTGTPGIAYDPADGSYHAFALGTNGNMYQDTYTPASGWGTWQNLGGGLQGGVSAVYVDGQFHVFSVSTTGNLYQDTWNGSWTGWQDLGNDSVSLTGSPGIAYNPTDGGYHAYAVGTNGNVYQDTYTPAAGWGTWQNLGGGLQGGVSAAYVNGQFHVFSVSTTGNLYQDTWNGSWSGWQDLGNDSTTLTGAPGIAYDSDDSSYHAFALATNGNVYQDTYTPAAGWGTWQNLGGGLQGGTNAVYVSPAGSGSSTGAQIATAAESQVGYVDNPADSYCNKYTFHWGVGSSSGCGSGTSAEEWCADFAAWAWQQGGVSFTYGFGSGDIDAAAASFYTWGVNHGTWHHAGSGYTPQPGDAVIYGLNSAGTSADHVAIVVSYTPGDAGPNVVNGDFGLSSGDDGVHSGSDQTTATGSDGISGYVSP